MDEVSQTLASSGSHNALAKTAPGFKGLLLAGSGLEPLGRKSRADLNKRKSPEQWKMRRLWESGGISIQLFISKGIL